MKYCSKQYIKTQHLVDVHVFIHNKTVTVLKNILNTYMGIKWMSLFCTTKHIGCSSIATICIMKPLART